MAAHPGRSLRKKSLDGTGLVFRILGCLLNLAIGLRLKTKSHGIAVILRRSVQREDRQRSCYAWVFALLNLG